MSAAGRDSPVSRKRPLGPAHGSPAARSGGGGVGGSGSPKAKRRLFAAVSGSRSTVASSSSSSSSAAEVDWLCRRRRLILLAGAAAAALSYVVLTRRRRKYSAQQFARLHDAIVGLASAVRAATAPVEPHPDLYVRDSTAPRPEEADRPLLAGKQKGRRSKKADEYRAWAGKRGEAHEDQEAQSQVRRAQLGGVIELPWRRVKGRGGTRGRRREESAGCVLIRVAAVS